MAQPRYHVLFLCTRNSARSVIAEAVLGALGRGVFGAHSAGSHPSGRIMPEILDLLERGGHDTAGLRSKSWDEFTRPDAPRLDFVFTLCDSAAGETCPLWPGQPMTAHWPFDDPADFTGSPAERRAAIAELYRRIHTRLGIFVNLPFASLDRLSLRRRLEDLGARTAADPVDAAGEGPERA